MAPAVVATACVAVSSTSLTFSPAAWALARTVSIARPAASVAFLACFFTCFFTRPTAALAATWAAFAAELAFEGLPTALERPFALATGFIEFFLAGGFAAFVAGALEDFLAVVLRGFLPPVSLDFGKADAFLAGTFFAATGLFFLGATFPAMDPFV